MQKIQQLFINRKLEILILCFFLSLNFSTTGGHEYAFDDLLYFMHAENLALNQSMLINPYNTPSAWDGIFQERGEESLRDQQQKYLYYQNIPYDENTPLEPFGSASSLLLPILTVPLYYFSLLVNIKPIIFLTFFSNTIILSFTAFMIYKTSVKLFSHRIGFTLALIFMVGTWIWSYNTGMMLRPLAALMIITGFYFITTAKNSQLRIAVGGICFGLSMLATSSAIILIPGLFLFGIISVRKNKKQMLFFTLGFLIILAMQGIINEIRFDSFLDFGFGPFQSTDQHKNYVGLYGYFTSLGWGIPMHFPLFGFFIVGLLVAWPKNRMYVLLAVYCFIVTWLFVGTLPTPSLWQGAPGWGPRYFTVILPLIILGVGYTISKFNKNLLFKSIFIPLAVWGFFMSVMGKLVWAIYGFSSQGEVEMGSHLLENRWFLHSYSLEYLPLNFHIQILSENTMSKYLNGALGGLAPCNYDLYVLCTSGFIPFILILAICGALAFLILKEFKHPISKLKQ